MARSVEMWVGKDDDAVPPPRVRVRVFDRCGGRCHRCTRLIRAGEKWVLEHRVAIINKGRNAEENLCLSCKNCIPDKNAEDVAEKSMVYRKRVKFIDRKRSRMAGSRDSKWKKRMDGTTVLRSEG